MQTPVYNTGRRHYCAHGALENRCESTAVPQCPHVDVRPLVQQLFGRGGSNSQKAAQIARQNPELYRKTQEEGRELGLLPKLNTPRCLQDPQ
jgi:hypothetical protein